MSADQIAVGVIGARGKMGTAVCEAVQAADGLELVAAIDAGETIADLVSAGVQVAVDFTNPDAVDAHVRECVAAGISVVVGTSGVTSAQLSEWDAAMQASESEVAVLVAANFSIAAVLMMRMATLAAPFFDSVEIVELHHPQKLDAPSGTANRTADLISEARLAAAVPAMPDATVHEAAGARGAVVGDVHVHSVRLQGLVAHQEVLFGSAGEALTIRHDSFSRESFMPGVILAVRHVAVSRGLTVGLDGLLGLSADG